MSPIDQFYRDAMAVTCRWGARRLLRVPVFLGGETGAGKGHTAALIASVLDVPLHIIDMTAISESLIDSELFGHVRGAFTGADRARKGLLEEEGVILIDEIGKAPRCTQAKLLRALDSGYVQPVGSNKLRKIKSPILLAALEDIDQMVKDGKFLGDLWHRIPVRLRVPSLRERPESIPEIASKFAREYGVAIEKGAMERMTKHQWPGNVRELRGFIERCAMLYDDAITEEHTRCLSGKRSEIEVYKMLRRGATIRELADAWGIPYSSAAQRLREGSFERRRVGKSKTVKYFF